MLSAYRESEQPKEWIPDPEYMQLGKQILGVMELYIRQQTALKNKLDILQSAGLKSGKMISSIKLQIKRVQGEISKLETELQDLLKANASKEMTQLMSIPGIGKKTAAMLMVYSNMYANFEDLLRITDVDPMELDLYFERFINLFRKSPPDFNIDFSWKDKPNVIQYIFNRFQNVALLAAYSTFKNKSIIRG